MERSFRSRGVEVKIREDDDRVELELDGMPVDVEIVDGQYHSQLANQFTGFDSVDELVETLLRNEGRVWSLRGAPGAAHTHGPRGGGHPRGHR